MSLKVLFGVLVVAALGAALWLANSYGYFNTEKSRGLSPATQTASSSTVGTTRYVQDNAIYNLTVAAITADTITVTNAENQTSTFALVQGFLVYSVVPTGEVGRGIDSVNPGTKITLFKSRTKSTEAIALAFARDSALSLTQVETAQSITGNVTAVGSSTVTVTPYGSATPVVVTFASTTKVVATVVGGEAGYPVALGNHVVVSGVTFVDDKVVAKLIVYTRYNRK